MAGQKSISQTMLQSWGWSDGKGLGKSQDGIAQPIKVALKASTTGIGHSSDWGVHWWENVYDTAAAAAPASPSDSPTVISIPSTTEAPTKNQDLYLGLFVRSSTCLTSIEQLPEAIESTPKTPRVTRERAMELYEACGGRTTRRYSSSGKLQRLAAQDGSSSNLLTRAKENAHQSAKEEERQQEKEEERQQEDEITEEKAERKPKAERKEKKRKEKEKEKEKRDKERKKERKEKKKERKEREKKKKERKDRKEKEISTQERTDKDKVKKQKEKEKAEQEFQRSTHEPRDLGSESSRTKRHRSS